MMRKAVFKELHLFKAKRQHLRREELEKQEKQQRQANSIPDQYLDLELEYINEIKEMFWAPPN